MFSNDRTSNANFAFRGDLARCVCSLSHLGCHPLSLPSFATLLCSLLAPPSDQVVKASSCFKQEHNPYTSAEESAHFSLENGGVAKHKQIAAKRWWQLIIDMYEKLLARKLAKSSFEHM
jgi:hypothetical protein